jgi:hypothetical protein
VKADTVRRLLSALSPAAAFFFLYAALLAVLTTSALFWSCVAIGVALAMLGASAVWLARTWPVPTAAKTAMWVTLSLTLVVWGWQRIAYLALIPSRFLTYGYFLTPEGRRPRFLLLEMPLWAAAIAFGLALAISCSSSWRQGHRALSAVLLTWWVAAYLTLAIPSLYLWVQGDAAIFI